MTAPEAEPVDGRYGMSTEGMTRAILDAGLGPYGIALYSVLARYADKGTRRAWPAVAKLAADTGISERKVRTLVQRGARLGLWTATVRQYSRTDAQTTLIVLHDWRFAPRRLTWCLPAEIRKPDELGLTEDSTLRHPVPQGGSESDDRNETLRQDVPQPAAPGAAALRQDVPDPAAPGAYEQTREQTRGSDPSNITPSATADGHAHARAASDKTGAWAEAVDAGLADALTAVGDALSVGGGSTPGQDEGVSDGAAPEPVSPPEPVALARAPRIDRAALRRAREGDDRMRRATNLGVAALRAVGAPSPATVRGQIGAVVRLAESQGADVEAIADRLDAALAVIAGVDPVRNDEAAS